jgi:hypothetical protein
MSDPKTPLALKKKNCHFPPGSKDLAEWLVENKNINFTAEIAQYVFGFDGNLWNRMCTRSNELLSRDDNPGLSSSTRVQSEWAERVVYPALQRDFGHEVGHTYGDKKAAMMKILWKGIYSRSATNKSRRVSIPENLPTSTPTPTPTPTPTTPLMKGHKRNFSGTYPTSGHHKPPIPLSSPQTIAITHEYADTRITPFRWVVMVREIFVRVEPQLQAGYRDVDWNRLQDLIRIELEQRDIGFRLEKTHKCYMDLKESEDESFPAIIRTEEQLQATVSRNLHKGNDDFRLTVKQILPLTVAAATQLPPSATSEDQNNEADNNNDDDLYDNSENEDAGIPKGNPGGSGSYNLKSPPRLPIRPSTGTTPQPGVSTTPTRTPMRPTDNSPVDKAARVQRQKTPPTETEFIKKIVERKTPENLAQCAKFFKIGIEKIIDSGYAHKLSGIKIPLHSYQLFGIWWLINQDTRCGHAILADDMGLGKVCSISSRYLNFPSSMS